MNVSITTCLFRILVLGFVMVGIVVTNNGVLAATLLFKSGFEEGVAISSDLLRVVGTDSETGYNWPNDLPGDTIKNSFNYITSDTPAISCVDTKIEDVIGHEGNPTRALYQNVLKNCATGSYTRNQYNLWGSGNNDADQLNKLYVRYWMKFDSELKTTPWRSIMELYEHWHIRIGNSVWDINSGAYNDCYTHHIPLVQTSNVPIAGEWFLLEVFFDTSFGCSSAADGVVWVKVNGQKILEYNTEKGDLSAWAFGIFANKGPIPSSGQWIDDVEIWDDIPAQQPICGDNSCNGSETCSSCPQDCGECPQAPASPRNLTIVSP